MKKLGCICLCALLLLPALSLATEGSWGQINQPLSRAEGWQRIVQESAFALGEAHPYEEDASICILDYNTYPSIDGSTVCVPLAMELARQHLNLP